MQLTDKGALKHFRPAYWVMLFLLLVVGHSGHPLDSDEGMVLNGAWNLWNGREPYTDFFEIMTPGSFYAVYWLWGLLGPHYMVAKALAVLSLFAACIGIHLTGRLLVSNGFSYAGPLLYALSSFAWPLINHNTFNIVLIIWAVYIFARSLDKASVSGMAASGMVAGFSALFLQHKSAILVLATAMFFFFLWRSDRRTIWLKCLAVYLLCAAAPMLILLRWPLGTLFESLVYFPLFNYADVNRVSLWPFWLACLALLGSMALLRGSSNRRAVYLVVIQAALLLTALQRTDLMHVSITLAPFLALLPYLHARAEATSGWGRLFMFSPALVFLIGFPVGIAASKLPKISLWGEGGAPGLIQYVRANCAGSPYLYAGPFAPGLYYETGKLNATSFSVLLTGFNTPEQFDQARGELEIHKPGCIVMNYAITRKFNYDSNNPVDEFIASNYRIGRSFGWPEVYVRAQ